MDEPVKKKVDESWKEQAEREKHAGPAPSGTPTAPGPSSPPPAAEEPSAHPTGRGLPEARFDLFISGLAMETLVALGDAPHPVTRKQQPQLEQAKYLIDLLGVLEEKTGGNRSADEEKLMKDVLYQLRMRYLAKTGG